MVALTTNKLGLGVYTIHDAALYTRVPPTTISRWLYGTKRFKRTIKAKFPEEERVVSFLDFVQALAIRNLRVHYNVPLQKIREGIQRAIDEFGREYPLARRRTMYLFGKDIFIRQEGEDFSRLTGRNREQKYMTKVVELYMKDISFDATTQLAKHYDVHKYLVDSESRFIRMDPEIRFGEPLVDNCKYSARALWEAVKTEGGIAEAAHAYGVDPQDVEAAFQYYDSLLIRHVA